MLSLQNITYIHPNRELLFNDISLSIGKHDKVALIGNNGSGKSTLLKLLAGKLQPSAGLIKTGSHPYYVPQVFGQFNTYTIAQALQVAGKLQALQEILEGNVSETNMALLNDDWAIEERCREALAHWKMEELDLNQPMGSLSGGQKTKVFLAGIMVHQPEIVLLDEPSNHLDTEAREILYDYIRSTRDTLVVVSHDRTLLNLLSTVYELGRHGITVYGGNYDFYIEQKGIAQEALNHELKNKEKALRKARETEKEAMERQQKLNARGKKKQEKAGIPTIMMNTLRNNAEKSTSRLKEVHAEKMGSITVEIKELRQELPDIDKMKMDFHASSLYKGKVLVTAKDINFRYDGKWLWPQNMSFRITSGQRVAIKGLNGSGKTTLIKLILGELQPGAGSIVRADMKALYIDQDYSLIHDQLTVYEQTQQYNTGSLQEHEIRIRLNRFLFGPEDWDKPCSALSGGEKMRLMLCSLIIARQAPDIIILDEPTNNLDIQNIEILTSAINAYPGTLLVVSHDAYFLKEIDIAEEIVLG